MDIYFRNEKSIIKMNEILAVSGKFLVMASLDMNKQYVLGKYVSEQRALQVLNSIDSIITRKGKGKEQEEILILEIPKD